MKAFSAELKVPEARPTPGTSEIMSVNQACTFLAVHRNTLYKLISEGEIPAFRLTKGGRWKFRRTDLEDWLTDRKARSVR
jgi:excisionase family DNA binding protein